MKQAILTLLGLALCASTTLWLAGAAGAQNITLELTPLTYPIALPDSGGAIPYLLTIANPGSAPISATVWCLLGLPDGSAGEPVLGPVTQTLGAGQTQTYYRAQTVSPQAPSGYYMLRARIGTYPSVIWAEDSLDFQKQAISGTEQIWSARYDGPDEGPDFAYDLALDGAGNVYVTGTSYASETYWDCATIKYDGSGNQIWVARYNGLGDGNDGGLSIAVDSCGNVYVAGYSYGSAIYSDYVTLKYDGSGNQLWAALYNGPGGGDDVAVSLGLDAAGNVYVTGRSGGSATSYDYATIKYDGDGHQLWAARYQGPGKDNDLAYALALDSAGNVYVTGGSWGSGTFQDYATIKYNGDGRQIWAARYDGPGKYIDVAYALALDAAGDVYVTGSSYGNEAFSDYATIKYDGDGNQAWAARYSGPGYYEDVAFSMAINSIGQAYVTGMSYGSGTSFDYATIKYDDIGNQLWVARYNGPGNYDDAAYSLALDDAGRVYVTGYSSPDRMDRDCATIMYDRNGNPIWTARYNGPGNNWDIPLSLALDPAGNTYITGYSWGSETESDYATLKYAGGNLDNWQPAEAVVFGQPLLPVSRLKQNSPNPFNATTVARFELRAASFVSLKVYDTAGRLVETLVDGWRPAGAHELTWDAGDLPSGIYIAQLKAGEFSAAQKMVLLK